MHSYNISYILLSGKLYCTAWGDPHFDTFDGAEIHFMGVGWYIMAERSPNCGHLKDFILLIEHEHRDGNMAFSWIKSIQLDVGTVNVNIDKLLIIRVSRAAYVCTQISRLLYWRKAVPISL